LSALKEWFRFLFYLKGYVAVNGASLTVAKRDESSFSVYLIPETLEATNLSEITEESFLNIEVDQSTYASMKRQK
jgi:Riboflavin synthase alpha chain